MYQTLILNGSSEHNVGKMSGLEIFLNVASLGVKSPAGDRSVMFSALRLVRLLITNRY